MNREDVLHLQRLLSNELDASEATRLRERLGNEPDLRRAYEQLELTWTDLALPDPSSAPVGMDQQISLAAIGAASDRIRWSLAPIWAQAAAAGALAIGIALGLGVASKFGVAFSEPVEVAGQEAEVAGQKAEVAGEVDAETTLAESYWLWLDEAAAESMNGSSEP